MQKRRGGILGKIAVLVTACFLTSSCVTTHLKSSPDLSLRKETRKILLMPMDIELSTFTAGGLLQPEAEWTQNATRYVETAVRSRMSWMNLNVVRSADTDEAALTDEEKEQSIQLVKLHEAVGYTILLHKYTPVLQLPGKGERFDWSLGPKARFLKEKHGADYALFIFLRDSYASAGRVATFVVAAAFGINIPMGRQTGFASLVDLETGDVVWFNRLARGGGDLRTEDAAVSSTELLLEGFPR